MTYPCGFKCIIDDVQQIDFKRQFVRVLGYDTKSKTMEENVFVYAEMPIGACISVHDLGIHHKE